MISESAQSILNKHRAEAERNRALMPQVAAWLDGLREFFPGARLVYAEEKGHVVGSKRPCYEVLSSDMPLTTRAAQQIPINKPPSKGYRQWTELKQKTLLI